MKEHVVYTLSIEREHSAQTPQVGRVALFRYAIEKAQKAQRIDKGQIPPQL